MRVPEVTFRVVDARTGRLLKEVEGPPLPSWVPAAGGGHWGGNCTFPAPDAYRPNPVRAAALDGRLAAVTGEDGTIYLWDLDRDRNVVRFRVDGRVAQMTFSPDGRTLATCNGPGEAWVYRLPGRDRP